MLYDLYFFQVSKKEVINKSAPKSSSTPTVEVTFEKDNTDTSPTKSTTTAATFPSTPTKEATFQNEDTDTPTKSKEPTQLFPSTSTNEQTSNNDNVNNASSKSKATGKSLYYLNTRVVNSGGG